MPRSSCTAVGAALAMETSTVWKVCGLVKREFADAALHDACGSHISSRHFCSSV